MDYPQSQHSVLEKLCKRKNRGKLWEKNTVMFTAMNVGNNHWTILAYMMDLREKSVCFFDPWVIQPLKVSLTCLELILGGSSALAGCNLMVFNVEFAYVGGRLLFWIGLQRGENFMTLRWKALFFLMLLWWNKYVIIVRL